MVNEKLYLLCLKEKAVDNKGIWLFSQDPHRYGGSETVIAEAKKVLSSAEIEYKHVWVSNYSRQRANTESQLYLKALPLPVYVNNVMAGVRWRKVLRENPFALVVGGSPASAGIAFAAGIPYGMWIATTVFDEYKSRSIRTEIQARNRSIVLNKMLIRLNKEIERRVLMKSKFIIAMSPYTLDSIERDYGIAGERLEYAPYPVRGVSGCIKRGFRREGPILLAVGRVDDERKNFKGLLRAFSHVHKDLPSCHLRIVGEVSPNSPIISKYRDLTLDSRVCFLGTVSDDELRREYENADIFVLSSLQEGLGIVFLEAMSFGLPVVTTKCGGPEGLVRDGVNGYLVPLNDEYRFANAIKKVWQSEDTYRRLSARARDEIIQKHNPTHFEIRLLEVLRASL